MPAAVRHKWMFRTAAAVFLALGAAWLWTALLTDYRPDMRSWTLGQGMVAVSIGVLLLRGVKLGIVLSTVVAVVIALAAVLFIPSARGPGVLVLALLALTCIVYAVFSLRILLGSSSEPAAERKYLS